MTGFYIHQKELIWFNKDEEGPSDQEKLELISQNNPDNPFNNFVGNENGVRRLLRAAYTAFGRYNRCCNDQNFALLGPASVGKTTMAKMYAKLIGIPFVEISPKRINKISDVIQCISDVLNNVSGVWQDSSGNEWEYTLSLVNLGDGKRFCPPIIVFIDEVHALKNAIVQGLLKATEKKDGILVDENGINLNCTNVCWVVATTDRGQLFDAFDTRFTKINLEPYTLNEISKIISINYPDWSNKVCDLVAKYSGGVPREAIAFAKEMCLEHAIRPDSWENIALTVAKDNNIDEHGMSFQRLKILKFLKDAPVPKNRLAITLNCKEEELEKFILPPMLQFTLDRNPLITVTSKGYTITETGLEELRKRGV